MRRFLRGAFVSERRRRNFVVGAPGGGRNSNSGALLFHLRRVKRQILSWGFVRKKVSLIHLRG